MEDTVGARGRPLIGLTSSELREKESVRPTPEGEPPQSEIALGLNYVRAVEAAGGVPVVLPPLAAAAIPGLLGQLSGICLSGGPDLDPATYGGARHPELGPTEPGADLFELELARAAWRRGLPILAICRGMQLLNVARGGTLIQHLPERVGGQIQHRQEHAAHSVTHSTAITRGSRLRELMGAATVSVNSFHHQAVDRVGTDLRVVAKSVDGVVEGLEAPAKPFVLGVQWHAECLVHRSEHAALFDAFVSAACSYRDGWLAGRIEAA
ncbi:MAG TPA: gamma-glutamyl-gamma-aminobutyrate hydrolase family protein [Thermoleophilaceae bacterium]|jgi:putative glutamine amidotransferase